MDLLDKKDILQNSNDWAVLGTGTVVSFVVALLCIRFMVSWVSKKDFMIFAYLRIITGILVLGAWAFGYQMQG